MRQRETGIHASVNVAVSAGDDDFRRGGSSYDRSDSDIGNNAGNQELLLQRHIEADAGGDTIAAGAGAGSGTQTQKGAPLDKIDG